MDGTNKTKKKEDEQHTTMKKKLEYSIKRTQEAEDKAVALEAAILEKNATIKKQQHEIKKQREEIKNLISTREGLIMKIREIENNANRAEAEQGPAKIPIFLSDSNGLKSMRIIQKQMEKEIKAIPTFTTADLTDQVNRIEISEAQDNDIIIMVGTNDIRQGEEAGKVMEEIEQSYETLKEMGARVKVTQIPPLKNSRSQRTSTNAQWDDGEPLQGRPNQAHAHVHGTDTRHQNSRR